MDDLDTDISVSLAEVVHRDHDLYLEVCQSFVDLYRVSVKVLDDRGSRLLDIPSRADLCQYIYEFPPCRNLCIQTVNAVRVHQPAFQTTERTVCFSGAEYRMVPIHYATDVVGKIVFGPGLPTSLTSSPKNLLNLDPGVDPAIAWEKTTRFRRMSPTLAEKVAQNLATVIEVMAFVGFKGQLTTDMHVESITEAYSELESKNKALLTSVEKLSDSNLQRSTFLARISRQLKTPLTNLIGYAEMLTEGIGGEITEDQQEFINTIIDQGEHIMGLTQTMDELSRIERQQVEIVSESIPVRELIDSAIAYGQKIGEQHDVEVEFLPPTFDTPNLWVDEEKIRSVLLRLVDNAVKFTPAGGRVLVSILGDDEPGNDGSLPRGFLGLAITDSGIGIDAPFLQRIFEPFFSVHGDHEAYPGTGVGLTITKAYVEAHGGTILVESALESGSTFTVLLPTRPSLSLQ